ncbi:MAG: UDP-2,4-diacetamido-2,4,6-trideoxy-beta-L-altropyranose hydrolase [Methanobacterium sp.]|nr:UDP-2,4-diacetamido-2,4,6-trideoxy-beta-L-altropyranose hydrolase [Methanobacterium sp.]
MKVLIITEGSSKIGFGHVTRCTSLYQAFSEKEASVHFIVNGDSKIQSILQNTDYAIFNWLEDSERLFKLLKDFDIVIIDSYLADEAFYQKLSKSVPLAAYIDDNNRINYPEGIVINGSILAERINYPLTDRVDYLLGSQYIPLRREFWSVPEKTIKTDIKSIMLTFGGDDLRNLTPDILKLLIRYHPDLNKKIVIGRGFKNKSEIEKLKDDKTELIYYPDAQGMLKTMLESDIAISAGGQTLYELARVGLPSISIGVAYNQTHNVKNWEKIGFIDFAGFWDSENLHESILEKLDLLLDKKIRIKKCRIGRKFVDGKGAIKIAKRCLNRYYSKKIKIRTANTEDINNVYELSNENEVRKNSFNTDKIEFEHHKKWFKDKLEDPDAVFLIAESSTEFLGQVRFDLEGNEATISISINKDFRELGLGSIIIKKSIEYLKLNIPHIKIIKAYIKESNKKSINLFEKMGFKNRENFWMENQDALLYIYKIRD